MPVTPAPGRLRKKNSKLKLNLCYTVRSCLKEKEKPLEMFYRAKYGNIPL
jgi:hypothetical protein